MIQKKICLLGAFAVGKTSLVQRYVNSLFSDKYLTTLGVKIDKKVVTVDDQDVNLMIWDLAGEDEFMTVRMSYLRGSSGFLLVADGTRLDTLETAKRLKEKIEIEMGPKPLILLINKSDVEDEWQISVDDIADLITNGWTVYKTSAKSGDYVEHVFQDLTLKMVSE
ncbi:MAG: GTP-binding protein [Gammaproteobacteria bacterium]|nr:MAG: GTP-binding protein [Gammaproteobacteria bacterium]